MTDEPTTLRDVVDELPCRRVALVILVVLVNLVLVILLTGRAIGHEREVVYMSAVSIVSGGCREPSPPEDTIPYPFLPPWEWRADEWRKTVSPWK